MKMQRLGRTASCNGTQLGRAPMNFEVGPFWVEHSKSGAFQVWKGARRIFGPCYGAKTVAFFQGYWAGVGEEG